MQSTDAFAVANGAGSVVRAAINADLQALATCSAGTGAPASPYPYQVWADTTNGLWKQRNGSNTAWTTLGVLDQAYLGLVLASAAAVSGTLALTGIVSPAQITANQNNYNPASLATAAVLRLDLDAARSLTGLAGGATGRAVWIHNISAFALTLKDEDAASTAANRFALIEDLIIPADGVVMLQYDSTSSRWRAAAIGATGAANVGAGAGLIYRDRTGNTLNLKTIKAGTGITVTNNADDVTIALGAGGNAQVFTSSGTWTKPSGATFVMVEAWGGGGAGGNGTPGDYGCGGGGGGYVRAVFKASDLSSSVSVSIAAGGAANSGSGGTTTFGSYLSAYGGTGGQPSPSPTNGGNGGSGLSTGRGGAIGGTGTGPDGIASQGGAGGSNASDGGWAEFGGGGGSGGGTTAGTGGGTSRFGGNGANSTGSTGGAGSAPGGGGSGGAPSTNGGAGARGECRVYSW